MMLGDEFQAIRKGTASFDKIRELFGDVEEFPLLTSYRSSPEITEIFTRLLPREKRIRTASVQRPGTAPVKMACASREDYLRRLKSLISAAKQEKGLTAVICGNRRSLERIEELLGEDALPVIRRNQALPSGGVFLITPELVKGLEFDGVILPAGRGSADVPGGHPVEAPPVHSGLEGDQKTEHTGGRKSDRPAREESGIKCGGPPAQERRLHKARRTACTRAACIKYSGPPAQERRLHIAKRSGGAPAII